MELSDGGLRSVDPDMMHVLAGVATAAARRVAIAAIQQMTIDFARSLFIVFFLMIARLTKNAPKEYVAYLTKI